MTSGPIEKRLRDGADSDEGLAARAGALLRALPPPPSLSESAHRRVLSTLKGSSRGGRGFPLTTLHWAVFSVILASTAAASARRGWFPKWFGEPPVVAEVAAVEEPREAVVAAPPPVREEPTRRAPAVAEEPPLPRATAPAPFAKPHPPAALKSAPVRPRLLTDPQKDAVLNALPRLAYDDDMYTVVLDVCVSPVGRVTKASVVRGQEPELDREIVEAVKRWSYSPAESSGQPVAQCFPLVYRIQVQRD